MKILSLFSGAGGLDLGLIQAGNEIVWANDIDKNAVETYRRNISNHIVLGDIKDIDVTELPDAEVVVGGFPCQGFSQANRFRMLDDERNILYRFFDEVNGKIDLSSRARMDYGATIPPKIVIPDFTNKEFLRWRWENYDGM